MDRSEHEIHGVGVDPEDLEKSGSFGVGKKTTGLTWLPTVLVLCFFVFFFFWGGGVLHRLAECFVYFFRSYQTGFF